MMRTFLMTILLALLSMGLDAQTDSSSVDESTGIVYSKPAPSNDIDTTDTEINWLSWEEAIIANQLDPRKIFVMVYTDWCKWCKKMESTSYLDSTVVEYLNRDFYPVKLNAESTDTINYKGHDFVFKASGERGYHQLAASLLNGKMNYPSLVILDERETRLKVIQGFQNVNALRNSLIFYAHDGHLKNDGAQFGFGYKCNNPSHRHTQPNYLGAPKK